MNQCNNNTATHSMRVIPTVEFCSDLYSKKPTAERPTDLFIGDDILSCWPLIEAAIVARRLSFMIIVHIVGG